jgi:hypothetical protein
MEKLEREALSGLLSAVREALRQMLRPAALGVIDNRPAFEGAYIELMGSLERWDEAMERDGVAISSFVAIEAFTCRCDTPEIGQFDICGKCGCFVPDSRLPGQIAKAA